jgi:hypothetical protein
LEQGTNGFQRNSVMDLQSHKLCDGRALGIAD